MGNVCRPLVKHLSPIRGRYDQFSNNHRLLRKHLSPNRGRYYQFSTIIAYYGNIYRPLGVNIINFQTTIAQKGNVCRPSGLIKQSFSNKVVGFSRAEKNAQRIIRLCSKKARDTKNFYFWIFRKFTTKLTKNRKNPSKPFTPSNTKIFCFYEIMTF